MLADQLDYVIGVDPHRDTHALAVVEVRSGAVVCEAVVSADTVGYEAALKLADRHAAGSRAFAVEGTGSFGAGLTRFLSGRDERVFEVSRLRRERRSGGKTDALDALRAARSILSADRPAIPRASGEREALRALVAAREGAVSARTAAFCQLRDLLITTPEPLRSQLRPLSRARLLARLSATRPDLRSDSELRGALLALKAVARRIRQLTDEERELAREIERLASKLAPQLLDQPGIGPLLAARSSSPGRTPAGSEAKPPSPAWPAPPRSRPRPARRSATDSTARATASSTAPSTRSSSPEDARTSRRSTTSTGASKRARAAARPPAASSATSPATSTDYSNKERRWRLDKHRSVAGPREDICAATAY